MTCMASMSSGGWSQANYERSIEDDVERHLKRVAEIVNRRWLQERFDRVAIGGQQETVPRFEELLTDEVAGAWRTRPGRRRPLERDRGPDPPRPSRSSSAEDEKRNRARDLLDRLADALGAGGRATGGPEATLEALNERRV